MKDSVAMQSYRCSGKVLCIFTCGAVILQGSMEAIE